MCADRKEELRERREDDLPNAAGSEPRRACGSSGRPGRVVWWLCIYLLPTIESSAIILCTHTTLCHVLDRRIRNSFYDMNFWTHSWGRFSEILSRCAVVWCSSCSWLVLFKTWVSQRLSNIMFRLTGCEAAICLASRLWWSLGTSCVSSRRPKKFTTVDRSIPMRRPFPFGPSMGNQFVVKSWMFVLGPPAISCQKL